MRRAYVALLSVVLLASCLTAQTVTPPATVGPTYFSTTGMRASYYDQTLTETTNIGVRVTSTTAGITAPQGLWVVMSVDATPRSQSQTAGLRVGARYFLKSTAGGNVIMHGNVQGGAVSAPAAATTAPAAAIAGSTFLGNVQGGIGATWRVCHTFNSNSKVNCILDLDYDLNAISTQAVKPLVGLFVGLAF